MLIEMHAHVLYGIDDGPQSQEDMLRMLYAARESGVEQMICTSHIAPGKGDFSLEDYWERLMEARAWCRENAPGLRLREGAEIYYTKDTCALLSSGQALPLAGTRLVLVEFSPFETTAFITEALETLAGCGWQPVLAHVERYRRLKDPKMLQALKDRLGVRVQMNAASVFREEAGFFFRRRVERLLPLVDFVASDAHDLSARPFCLQYACHWLKNHRGIETAEKLCGGNILACLPDNEAE